MYKHKNGITLKTLEFCDLEDMKKLKDESWFGTHRITIKNNLQQNKWFENIDNEHSIFLIAYNSLEEKVGVYKISNIDWISRTYDSAHDVFEKYRGQGYGKTVLEAGVDFGFEILNMHRINTEVLENNSASLKTALYVGYIKEGLKRKSVIKCGEYLDSICLGILRQDWTNLDRVKNYNNICNFSYTPKDKK